MNHNKMQPSHGSHQHVLARADPSATTYNSAIRKSSQKMAKAIFLLLAPINIFFWFFEYISKRINGIGIDESVFYHLRSMQGAGYGDFNQEILIGGIGIFIILATIVFIYRKQFSKKPLFAALFLLGIGTYFNAGVTKTVDYFSSQTGGANTVKIENFESIEQLLTASGRNLVYLYLESFENTFTNEHTFPGLTPNINALKKKGFSLEDAWMPYGTNWTIAGMVGSQCGLPLTVDDYDSNNSLQKIKDFLPKANCLGDILKAQGYNNYYYGGADINFGGKKNFYTTHGFHPPQGIHEIAQRHPIKNRSSWGIYDDEFFDILKKELPLLKKSSPYALLALNLDTHAPHGHLSKYCENIVYGDGKSKMLNAVHCTDKLVADFVSFVQAEDPSALVVISSDHLVMPSDAKDKLADQRRRNLFIALGQDVPAREILAKSSTFDFAATTMGLLGFDVKGLGWGRNLVNNDSFSSQFEKPKDFNRFLTDNRSFHRTFWGNTKFQGASYIKTNNRFYLAGQNIEAPFAALIDNDKNISKLMINGDILYKLLDNKSNYNKSLIYVDLCADFKNSKILPEDTPVNTNEFCYLISSNNSTSDSYGFVANGFAVSQDMKSLKKSGEIPRIFSRPLDIIYQGGKIKSLQSVNVHIDNTVIDISGDVKTPSRLTWKGKKYPITRGITFYGYSANHELKIIAQKDFCNSAETAEVPAALEAALQDPQSFDYIIYLTADSAFCGKETFDAFIQKLPQKLAIADIGFQEPIFAKIENGQESFVKEAKATRMVIGNFQ